MSHWHDYNPWAERVVYVPIEELAEVLAGGQIQLVDGTVAENDKEQMLASWNRVGYSLDAYLLPNQAFGFSAGIRYGSHDNEYLSLYVRDQTLVWELYERHCADPIPRPN